MSTKTNGKSPRTLRLPVKAIYFRQIATGEKPEEFRLQTEYWRKRLEGREYDYVEISLGYPAAGDTERRMFFKWRGYRPTAILHQHFGDEEVEVFAIDVSERISL